MDPQPSQKLKKSDLISLYRPDCHSTISLISFIESDPNMFSKDPQLPENLNLKEIPIYNDIRTYQAISILTQPFVLCGCGEITSREWYYIDENRVTQGPYTPLEMDNWFTSGFLYDQLLIKYKENGNLIKLEDFCIKVSRMVSREQKVEQNEKKKFSFNF